MKKVGKVNDIEKNEIKVLFEKKNALECLIKVIDSNNEELYNRIITDYTKVFNDFQKWWIKMNEKYNWEGDNWQIDFETNDILMS